MIYIKKFFIVFVCMLILVSCFVVPCFGATPGTFGDYYNLLDVGNKLGARFYTSTSYYEPYNFFSVNLNPNTDYTFISTKGTRDFYIGQLVYDDTYTRSVYSFDSWNLVDPSLFADGYVCIYDPVTDTINMNRRSGGNRFSSTAYVNLPSDTYIISIQYSGSASYLNMLINGGNKITFLNPDVYGGNNTFTFTGSISSLQFYLDNGFAEGTTADAIKFYIRPSSENRPYIDYYSNPLYIDFESSVSYFTTGNVSNNTTFLVGLNDVLLDLSDIKFSSTISSDNEFYLIEGKLTVDEISEIIDGNNYQNGYDTGYDVGFSQGETSGLEASGMLRNVIFTIFSVPFIFIRNALDFEILGINFKNIVLVLLSATLVAWVIRTFKKGE